jgi:hypothetical protein
MRMSVIFPNTRCVKIQLHYILFIAVFPIYFHTCILLTQTYKLTPPLRSCFYLYSSHFSLLPFLPIHIRSYYVYFVPTIFLNSHWKWKWNAMQLHVIQLLLYYLYHNNNNFHFNSFSPPTLLEIILKFY